MAAHEQPALSIVIPCYNEAEVLPLLRERLTQALDKLRLTWEVVLVDDGSGDTTFAQLTAAHRADARFKAVALSRNFGHQAAICAGLAHATGDAVAIMDADLQDPPEILGSCLEKLRGGFDVVYAVRRKRKENILLRCAYAIFYRLLKSIAEIEIPLDSGDFCVVNRNVADVLRRMPERNVFLRGLRAWSGFRQTGLEYERAARAAGETKYPFRKLLRLALDGVFAFSTAPLRLATYLGFTVVLAALGTGLFIVSWRLAGFSFMGHTAHELPGWTAVVGAALFFGGVQLLILGILGEYLARIYAEVKQRPRWVVRETLGVTPAPDAPSAGLKP
ncbi:MAG: glycosyltransferase [Pedosphaera sp.]|nr:glycosyltransferase [Pedosphaera sp.]